MEDSFNALFYSLDDRILKLQIHISLISPHLSKYRFHKTLNAAVWFKFCKTKVYVIPTFTVSFEINWHSEVRSMDSQYPGCLSKMIVNPVASL